MAREKKPALILMDFHLPKMNGIEAFQALRADVETSSIPVIAVTASAKPEDRKKILEAGFDGMQTKAIHVVEFLSSVEKALSPTKGTLTACAVTGSSWPQARIRHGQNAAAQFDPRGRPVFGQ